jgi:hypothetical protein
MSEQTKESDDKRILKGFDNTRQIAIIWDIGDVLSERPNLTSAQAMEVLRQVSRSHDAMYGVTWETLKDTADALFPGNNENLIGKRIKAVVAVYDCPSCKGKGRCISKETGFGSLYLPNAEGRCLNKK